MWDEITAAAEVAKHGTVSQAAKSLKVHRATIIRRIDALEEHLGRKIFQRHKDGYTPTEVIDHIVEIARSADDQLKSLDRFVEGEFFEFTGELIVTSSSSIAPKILKHIDEFQQIHPNVQLTYKVTHEPLDLAKGEAHVAFRHFDRPTNPDYVVIPQPPFRLGLYASKRYISRFGHPEPSNLDEHRFVVLRAGPDPEIWDQWIERLTKTPSISTRVNNEDAIHNAIELGLGVGYYPVDKAEHNPNLVRVLPTCPKWKIKTWIVTHVDLHRSPKVKAFLEVCRGAEH